MHQAEPIVANENYMTCHGEFLCMWQALRQNTQALAAMALPLNTSGTLILSSGGFVDDVEDDDSELIVEDPAHRRSSGMQLHCVESYTESYRENGQASTNAQHLKISQLKNIPHIDRSVHTGGPSDQLMDK